MTDDGSGPGSDEAVVNGAPIGGDENVEEDLEWPIGFMVMLALAALYLGWRLVQFIGGLFDFIG